MGDPMRVPSRQTLQNSAEDELGLLRDEAVDIGLVVDRQRIDDEAIHACIGIGLQRVGRERTSRSDADLQLAQRCRTLVPTACSAQRGDIVGSLLRIEEESVPSITLLD